MWLRIEGAAALLAGGWIYLTQGGPWLLLVPLLLAVDISMAGYLRGPALGATLYNIAHNWALGLAVMAIGVVMGSPIALAAGGVLVGHVGMDRAAGYGLKYPTAFGNTHLGRIGRAQ
jgi:hypothetical protein